MDILVLGGTVFLGRAVVSTALAQGARVAVFNRGRSGVAPDGVEQITGDRTAAADLAQLAGRSFDVVVDTSGYEPADVARSAGLLAARCGHYAFVSTINVFPGWPDEADYQRLGTHAGDPDATAGDVPAGLDPGAAYGWLKAGCELAAARAFGAGRSTALRAGCIVGPDDSQVGRLPWWIDRVARGGEVLVPGAPDDAIALIDARDLAAFALAAVPGTFETGGPSGRDTRADLMAACRRITGSDAGFTYVGDAWPVEQGVTPWTELPLWAPGARGLFTHDTAAAEAAGLSWRPLADTVADTWAWQRSLDWTAGPRTPGLAADRESELLTAWHASVPSTPAG
ncbi:NAD-dependent epimerase/dehydratase family protein [Jatrophihabitans cynanchi]|jgi:2'-hydroxyisoflavone reductase|uniref:NAD-dependent epimerase/dehydratase family protein n=1 Tax=Jatrophihabitans cynanchi TaxID=2944128 RepID=A0ABY7JS96_9ACTN|nr:NAD-dependent epimerase/dehydratase family protein [Jatrophihabitans sp. SB3-54]WAX55422.1 NAD-dependent epimerase/dehydratase family protein [Jatrophihabitans sp. SB3-54]